MIANIQISLLNVLSALEARWSQTFRLPRISPGVMAVDHSRDMGRLRGGKLFLWQSR
jgi:hypothetical protein